MNLKRFRLGVAFVLCVGVAVPGGFSAERTRQSWSLPDGKTVEGQVAEVFGSMVLIKTKQGQTFLPLGAMTDEPLERVRELEEQRGRIAWAQSKSRVAKAVAGKLEQFDGTKLVPFAVGERPEPDFYLIYFSAAWCGPCQRFTPELVKAYHRFQQMAPGRVELIFVSNDTGPGEQLGYVKKAAMPWPMVKFSKLGSAAVIERWAGAGIPCLVAVTREGDAFLHSYRGEEYVGPNHVLQASEQVLSELVGRSAEGRRARHRLEVLKHLRAAGEGDAAAAPYLIVVDRARYGAIAMPKLVAEVSVDERGAVADVTFGDEISRELSGILREDAAKWLFLPAVKEGKPVRRTLRIPLSFDAPAAAGNS